MLVVTVCLLLILFSACHKPGKVVIGFDLENCKIFKLEKHLYLKSRVDEIRFDDVESVEQESMYHLYVRPFETELILKAKCHVGSFTIKKTVLSQEKLEQIICLLR